VADFLLCLRDGGDAPWIRKALFARGPRAVDVMKLAYPFRTKAEALEYARAHNLEERVEVVEVANA
jgi:hypothetical protein